MRNLAKIGIFILVVALGIFIIDNSLSAELQDCNCIDEYEAESECHDICWGIYGVDCLYTYEVDHGGEYTACVTTWRFKCENDARGYVFTEWDFCWDCY